MSVTSIEGVVASGTACGLKASGAKDLALVAAEDRSPMKAVAVFTQNRFAAAPVLVSREHLRLCGGRAAAVVVNSGNANAGTGSRGIEDARRICSETARLMGVRSEEVLICSTGIIGVPLDVAKVVGSLPLLVDSLSPAGGADAAEAIMTTDTRPKTAFACSGSVSVGGIAKGAAMLAPSMATMLALLATDADLETSVLQEELRRAVDHTFNRITVDGARSTNDTVVLLSTARGGDSTEDLRSALSSVCEELAEQMVRDAEGATKFVRITVSGARSDREALVAARRVAESMLVKCSFFGGDPYWGRIASEVGASGVEMDPDRLCVAYGGVVVADAGVAVEHDREAVANHMAGADIEVEIRLGLGTGEAVVLTSDLGHGYIEENKGTS